VAIISSIYIFFEITLRHSFAFSCDPQFSGNPIQHNFENMRLPTSLLERITSNVQFCELMGESDDVKMTRMRTTGLVVVLTVEAGLIES